MEVKIEVKLTIDDVVAIQHQITVEDGTAEMMQSLSLEALALLNKECQQKVKELIPV